MNKRASLIIIYIWVLCFSMTVTISGPAYADKKYAIKFATVAPEGSLWVKHMKQLDKTIREESDGQLSFRLYTGGIAGDELDVLRKIRVGQIHCAAFSGAGIAQILPMARILDLPFLFRNQKELEAVKNDLFDLLSKSYRENGFEFLAWAEVGDVHLLSKKSIQEVDDLAGLKVWTWTGDPISKSTFSAMGTNPIPMAITEVSTALNTGMVDTVYAPPIGALALQWHSHVKYMTSFPIAHSTGAILISKKYYDSIPDQLTNMLKDKLAITMTNLASDLNTQNKETKTLIKQAGVELTPMPSDSELQKFYSIHEIVAKDLTGDIYPDHLLRRVYEVLGNLRKNP